MKHLKITTRRLVLIAALVSCPVLIMGAIRFSSAKRAPNLRVQFVNSRVGWIIGPRLLETRDGGHTWNVIRRDGYGTFEAETIGFGHRIIQFINPDVGVQLGLNAIAKTTDGGRTWSDHFPLPRPRDQGLPSGSLFFLSPEVGWVIGESVYHTSDGGRSWSQLSMTPRGVASRQRGLRVAPTIADFIPALWFLDTENGLMARMDGDVYRTEDGGRNWKLIWRVDKRIRDIFFVNGQDGWLAGDGGFVARTKDGGRTWTPTPVQEKEDLTSLFFLNNQLGWATGSHGTILRTRDGGVTWKLASVDGLIGSPPLASVSFVDELHGWAVGGNSDPMYPSLFAPSNVVLATDDGGETWHAL